jgi:hypothetical protein
MHAACRFEVGQERNSMFVRCSCVPAFCVENILMANFEKRTGRLRTGDLFSTTQVTCEEIKAASIVLCEVCLNTRLNTK